MTKYYERKSHAKFTDLVVKISDIYKTDKNMMRKMMLKKRNVNLQSFPRIINNELVFNI